MEAGDSRGDRDPGQVRGLKGGASQGPGPWPCGSRVWAGPWTPSHNALGTSPWTCLSLLASPFASQRALEVSAW